MRLRLRQTRVGRRVEAMRDLWKDVAESIPGGRIECEDTVTRRVNVVVHPHARGAALGARTPVGEERVAQQHAPVRILQARLAPDWALPDAEIVTHVRLVGRAAEELPRNQAVLIVHARVDLGIDLNLRGHERMAVHVAADVPR